MRDFNKPQEQKLVLYFSSQLLIFKLIYHTADQTTTPELLREARREEHLDVVEMAQI